MWTAQDPIVGYNLVTPECEKGEKAAGGAKDLARFTPPLRIVSYIYVLHTLVLQTGPPLARKPLLSAWCQEWGGEGNWEGLFYWPL